MKCPDCGSVMVKHDSGLVYTSYPAQTKWQWWCGCGYRGEWVWETESVPPTTQEDWEQANKIE